MDTKSGRPRVLIFSLRNIFGNTLFRCPHYEFEDLICEIDSAVLWAPEVDLSNTLTRLAYPLPKYTPRSGLQGRRVECDPRSIDSTCLNLRLCWGTARRFFHCPTWTQHQIAVGACACQAARMGLRHCDHRFWHLPNCDITANIGVQLSRRFSHLFARVVRMRETGTLGGNPFELLGLNHFGVQAFFQGIMSTWLPIQYAYASDMVRHHPVSFFSVIGVH